MDNYIDLPQLELSLLRKVLSFLYTNSDSQVWLVGGAVRDLLSGEKRILDLDLAVNFDPLSPAAAYAKATGAGFVVLDDVRRVVRVVKKLRGLHYTIDISKYRAENIDEDLKLRDFTFNSIAALLPSGLSDSKVALYDPLEGAKHLKEKVLKPSSNALFKDDPLRIMRAFRFSATLQTGLSNEIKDLIKENVYLMKDVAFERIRDELFKVLETANSTSLIKQMNELGVLDFIFPELARCKAVEQNEWHHLDVFDHSILTLENFENYLANINEIPHWNKIKNYFEIETSGTRTNKQIYKLACLLHDVAKPLCASGGTDTQKKSFHGHEMLGSQTAKNISQRLKLTCSETQLIQLITKNHMRPGVILQQGITDRRLFRYFLETGRDGVGIALLSLSDRMSALGNCCRHKLLNFKKGIYEIISRFYEQLAKPKLKPLLTGGDLIKELNIEPGPIFKEILEQVTEAQHLNEISTHEEALELGQKIYQATK